jgi:hypothetical protein
VKSFNVFAVLAVAACGIGLTGCSTPDPVRYTGLQSADHLAPNPQDDSGRVPYRYQTAVDWQNYDRMIIDPVVVYRGADNQFSDMSERDRQTLATYMGREFSKKMGRRFSLVHDAAPRTLRLKLTLTGADTNTPVVSTLMRFDLAGGLYNGVQAMRGREGVFNGAVMYSVELFDAETDRLLDAYVAKEYPNAYDIGATVGSLAAAKVGIEKGAEGLAESLR